MPSYGLEGDFVNVGLEEPIWLLLLPLALLLSRWFPKLQLARPSRLIPWLLLTLAISRPFAGSEKTPIELWVLVDRSESANRFVDENLQEWRGLLERSKPKRDRLRWLAFAHDTVEGEPDRWDDLLDRRDATRLRSAVEKALAQVRPDQAARILLLSDGFSTESLDGLSRRLAAGGVALDVRLVGGADSRDWRALGLRLPTRVGSGESVLAELQVAGAQEGRRSFIVRQNGKAVGEGEVTVRRGLGRARFVLPPLEEGAHAVEVELVGEGDPQHLNNRAIGWTLVGEQKGILLITASEEDPLIPILSAAGKAPRVERDARLLHPGVLGGVRVVIFNNVRAGDVNRSFLDALPFHIESTGAGLVMLGGKNSFGSGGYFKSALDPLLPVSMELRKEHRKLLLTMSIMLDRSGSMMASAGGGRNKMDLANDGTARAIEMLQPEDAVAVFAVDTLPHPIIKLRKVGEERDRLMSIVRRIESQGGGIFVYEALRAGWDEIKDVQHGTRHMILFSDAADSEEPGDYVNLLAEIRQAGGTVSVIGLGSDSDVDAQLLRDVAARGGGRIFFSNDANDLPTLFAQETAAVARSTFVADITNTRPTGFWAEIASENVRWLAAVEGYNLSYLRPGATQSLLSDDEYRAPLVAHWRRGLGRVVAVCFPLIGSASATTLAWSDLQLFIHQIMAWTSEDQTEPGAAVQVSVLGSELLVDFLYEDEWERWIGRNEAQLLLNAGGAEIERLPWNEMEPGRFRARISLDGRDWVRGVVKVGERSLPFGPVAAAVSPEWTQDPAMREAVRKISAESGGREIVDLAKVWNVPRTLDRQSLFEVTFGAFVVAWIVGLFHERLVVPGQWPKRMGRGLRQRAGTSNEEPSSTPPQKLSRPKSVLPTDATPVADRASTETVATPGIQVQPRKSRFARAKIPKETRR